MNKKLVKVLSAILCLSMCLAMFAGCSSKTETPATPAATAGAPAPSQEADDGILGNMYLKGLPIVKEQESFSMLLSFGGSNDPNEMQLHKQLEEMTNIKVNYTAVSSAAKSERKSTVFASGEYPDTMGGALLTDTEVVTYGAQGVFIPLEDLIAQYAPNLQSILDENPDMVNKLTAPDGHIYSLPMINYRSVWPSAETYVADQLLFNKDWLAAVGKEVPTTIDEFYDVLVAFRDGDPNGNGIKDEIPFTFIHKGWGEGLKSMFGMFGFVDNTNHIMIEDGKVICTANTEAYKEAIQFFSKLYKEGLMDSECFTHDKQAYIAKCAQEPTVVGSLITYAGYNEFGLQRVKEEYVAALPMKGASGEQLWSKEESGFWRNRLVITCAAEHPEMIMRWADNLYDPEISVQVTYGPYGLNIEKNAEGTIDMLPAPEGMSTDQFLLTGTTRAIPYAVIGDIVDKINIDESMQYKNEISKLMAPFCTQEYYPMVYNTAEETETLSITGTPITTFIDQKQAQWISGQADINAEWEGYLDQLNKMGLDQVLEVRQQAYDRYYGK